MCRAVLLRDASVPVHPPERASSSGISRARDQSLDKVSRHPTSDTSARVRLSFPPAHSAFGFHFPRYQIILSHLVSRSRTPIETSNARRPRAERRDLSLAAETPQSVFPSAKLNFNSSARAPIYRAVIGAFTGAHRLRGTREADPNKGGTLVRNNVTSRNLFRAAARYTHELIFDKIRCGLARFRRPDNDSGFAFNRA